MTCQTFFENIFIKYKYNITIGKFDMKFKDYLAEEELKHKLYTKEEMRELRAKSKAEAEKENGSAENIDDDQQKDAESAEDEKSENSEDTSNSIIGEIKSALKQVTEDADIVTDADVYIAKQDDKEFLGYFVYKKKIGDEQDDFYVGKFIYRVAEQKLESLVDDIKESFKNLAEAEEYIKSYQGVKV